MGYHSLVQNQVNKAFTLVKDLAIDVSLTKREVTGFDFNTKQVISSAPVTTTVKAILVVSMENEEQQQPNTKVMIKSTDLSEPDSYDKIIINGVTWNIVQPYTDDGFVITITITKGV